MKREITEKINRLKKEKNAVILAHYYTEDDVQAVADYVGDSFYLAKTVKESSADIIVFCGVRFMGESAKILNPDKKVLMPSLLADCPMAHMADIKKIEALKKEYEDLAVVCYINSTAELKCHSDVCVTSSNALKIVNALPNKNIFFIPDKNLGSFVKENVMGKNIILNDGYCPIHIGITKESILREKGLHPSAPVLSHPECEKDALEISDYIGSTADIIKYVKESGEKEFIIATEMGVAYQLKEDNPDSKFYFAGEMPKCKDMKLNTLEGILEVLEKENNEVCLDADFCQKALKPLDKMLELAK